MEFRDMIEERRKYKNLIHELECQMVAKVLSFDGTIKEALEQKMIKLNFSAPVGVLRHLKDK